MSTHVTLALALAIPVYLLWAATGRQWVRRAVPVKARRSPRRA